jgi:ribonuclease J
MLQVAFLGGVGEFGKNMTVLEQDGAILVVDAGAMFPEADLPGIDRVIPDLTYLEENRDRVVGLVLTHGHEDHIGAAPFLLERVPVPVWSAALTLGFLKRKLSESEAEPTALTELKPGQSAAIGPFRVEPIPVTHSIPDACSLVIRTRDATIVHSGDFKFDQSPLDGRRTHYHRFQEVGEEGVTALLIDSTNVEVEGMTGSETVAAGALEKYMAEQEGQIVISLFSTNLMRIQAIYGLAAKYGKKVALFGRTLVSNCKVAEEVGYLRVPGGVSVAVEDVPGLPRNEVIVLATGSQGEPTAALNRIAFEENRHLRFEEGDLLLHSARLIPGNEKRIGRIINQVYRKGAEVVTARNDRIHVSGHAAQEEIKLLASWIRPKYYVPIHGEFRQLKGNAALAWQMGVPREHTLLRENGDALLFEKGELTGSGQVPVGSLLIDGDSRDPVDHVVVRDRRHLATDGVVMPVVVMNLQKGRLESSPEVVSRGYSYLEGDSESAQKAHSEVRAKIQSMLESLPAEELRDGTIVKAKVKSCVKKCLKATDQPIPLIIPVVMEI